MTRRIAEAGASNKQASNEIVREIAILVEDHNEAAELASSLKRFEVWPSRYDDNPRLWDVLSAQPPLAAIVDVRLLSDGKRSLLDHPMVKQKKVPLIFYYDERSLPLLRSTTETFHLGYIKRQVDYVTPLKTLLARFNHFYFMDKRVEGLQQENEVLLHRKNQLFSDIQNRKQRDEYYSLLNAIRTETGMHLNEFVSIERVVARVMDQMDQVTSFALLGLDAQKTRIIPVEAHHKKSVSIPSIWLGQKNENGIDVSSFSLASQVAVDIMGGEVMTLELRGLGNRPEMILILKTDNQDFLQGFEWDVFEFYLSSFYARYLLTREKARQEERIQPLTSLMSRLDSDFFQSNENGDYQNLEESDGVLNVNLSQIVSTVQEQADNRFYWSRFHDDFHVKLAYEVGDAPIFSNGLDEFFVVTSMKNQPELFQKLKNFAMRFGAWRFFEDSERMVTANMKISVRSVPASTPALLAHLRGNDKFFVATSPAGKSVAGKKSNTALEKRMNELQL